MAGGGGQNDNQQQLEWVYIVFLILIGGSAWLLWAYARKWVVLPAFASNWLMIQCVELLRGLKAGGLEIESTISSFFDGRRNASRDIDWQTFVYIRTIVGEQVKIVIAAIICCFAVLIGFKMQGDGFKRVFSLGGGKGKGPSLAAEQAKKWKTATMGALFDPDGRDKDILPARTPPEWMRDNGVRFEDGELDTEAAEKAFSAQLGKSWHGVKRADLTTQVVMFLAGLHLTRSKKSMAARENMSIAWSGGQDGTKAMKELVAECSANEKLCGIIDKVCAKNAFSATALITMMDLARRKSGVLPAADFIWMRRADRSLWYALNNVGRRRFHTEGAGAISHFFAERVVGNPLPEAHVDQAISGLEDYLDEMGLESLELFFAQNAPEEF